MYKTDMFIEKTTAFLTYEQTLILTDLGLELDKSDEGEMFQIYGFYYLRTNADLFPIPTLSTDLYNMPTYEKTLPAPLIQQAYEFFRIEYGFIFYIEYNDEEKQYRIKIIIDDNNYCISSFKDYDFAVLNLMDNLIGYAKIHKKLVDRLNDDDSDDDNDDDDDKPIIDMSGYDLQ